MTSGANFDSNSDILTTYDLIFNTPRDRMRRDARNKDDDRSDYFFSAKSYGVDPISLQTPRFKRQLSGKVTISIGNCAQGKVARKVARNKDDDRSDECQSDVYLMTKIQRM